MSVFCGSDQMLMRRFGSTPSQRLTFAFHTVPATGGGGTAPRNLPTGIATSRLQPLSMSVRFVQVPRSDGGDLHAGRVEALEERAAVVVQVIVKHAARVHLEAVVDGFLLRIRIDENLHRVVPIGRIVALLEPGGDVRVVGVEADVERLRVPEQARSASSAWRRSANPTGTGASWRRRRRPCGLVELAVNRGGRWRPFHVVARDGRLAHEGAGGKQREDRECSHGRQDRAPKSVAQSDKGATTVSRCGRVLSIITAWLRVDRGLGDFHSGSRVRGGRRRSGHQAWRSRPRTSGGPATAAARTTRATSRRNRSTSRNVNQLAGRLDLPVRRHRQLARSSCAA